MFKHFEKYFQKESPGGVPQNTCFYKLYKINRTGIMAESIFNKKNSCLACNFTKKVTPPGNCFLNFQ